MCELSVGPLCRALHSAWPLEGQHSSFPVISRGGSWRGTLEDLLPVSFHVKVGVP